MQKENTYCVIMAGGIGSRFWPMSTAKRPKQFLDILGTGKSLIRQTYERFLTICPAENILVVTNENYLDLVREELPEINETNILLEPSRKNTAPCIAYANAVIKSRSANANVIVAPSDHLVTNQNEFERIIDIALHETENNQTLVTLGILPSRPDTGYGYIQFEASEGTPEEVQRVIKFTEKPDLPEAKQFLQNGNYFWNSGIFVWNINVIEASFSSYLPETAQLFEQYFDIEDEKNSIAKIYNKVTSVSIDYGIMEKTANVSMVKADFGWSDLGTWGSLYTHLPLDESGNGILGDKVIVSESSENIINVPKDKRVIVQGLEGIIVVEHENTLLICKKEDEQKVKSIVEGF